MRPAKKYPLAGLMIKHGRPYWEIFYFHGVRREARKSTVPPEHD